MRTEDYEDPQTKNKISRWRYLSRILNIIVEIACIMDHDGVDLHFLNRKPVLGVKSTTEISQLFETEPRGGTPLVPVLRDLLSHSTGRRLILIVTDGEPTTILGDSDVHNFKKLLGRFKSEFVDDHVQIVACTTSRTTMSYLDDLDRKVKRIDVTEDYTYERTQIIGVQGRNFPFTLGDYVCKLLLGPIAPSVDALDEYRMGSGYHGHPQQKGCCNLI